MAGKTGLAKRIEETRKARGMSRSEFARLTGVSPTAVWNWEENSTKPRSEILSTISKVLGVTENFLNIGAEEIENVPKTVSILIDQARHDIARAAGISPGRVKITVEFTPN